MQSWNFEPIGWMRCDYVARYETPRQPVFAGENQGVIELCAGRDFEQAVFGLEGFSRIWVTFIFHLNEPPVRPVVMVQPPRYADGRLGVFATRSPHRPNPIGLSCLRLEKIEGCRLHVRGFDLLDGTPVLDIKPYVPICDAFPDAASGWVDSDVALYQIQLSPLARAQSEWIHQRLGIRLDRFAHVQLQEDPLNEQRKRIQRDGEQGWILFYRDWRILYDVHESSKQVLISAITSALTRREGVDDYALHKAFLADFPS